jgi:E3 ubiquitin-protein ligase MUL1
VEQVLSVSMFRIHDIMINHRPEGGQLRLPIASSSVRELTPARFINWSLNLTPNESRVMHQLLQSLNIPSLNWALTNESCTNVVPKPPSGSATESLCVICLEVEPNHVFIPCGHLACCGTCGPNKYKTCPVCRDPTQGVYRVYRV